MGFLTRGLIAVGLTAGLSACEESWTSKKIEDPINVVDASDLNEVMLKNADPASAVKYFRDSLIKAPDRVDLQRGLALSLLRGKRTVEAVPAFEKLMAHSDATNQDRIDYASALIRTNNWAEAERQLNKVPPTIETYQRYRLEAMVADSNKKWRRADSFYENAQRLTQRPAKVLNNWGYSKLTRGDHKGAERLFIEAITHDPKLFTAKNNLVLARASQGNFELPVIPMTEEERAQLMYSAGLSAAKQGQRDTARALFENAIDAHPRHFAEAVRSLESLNRSL